MDELSVYKVLRSDLSADLGTELPRTMAWAITCIGEVQLMKGDFPPLWRWLCYHNCFLIHADLLAACRLQEAVNAVISLVNICFGIDSARLGAKTSNYGVILQPNMNIPEYCCVYKYLI